MSFFIVVAVAILLDFTLGELRRWHPLVGFGSLANRVESLFYRPTRRRGIAAVALLLLPALLAAYLLHSWLGSVTTVVLLYFAVGWRSLHAHARPIAEALELGDITSARRQLQYIVSRDTDNIDAEGISRATVESVLENGCDAIFAAIFWAAVAGAPGVVLYRLANTLDAMWGYKNEHYLQFGWAAARLDDLLNYIPARLTAFSYSAMGSFRHGLSCWRTQGQHWKSPNAGPVMSAGAGSLGLLLGGRAQYHGSTQSRPTLGRGRAPIATDIRRSLRLIDRALILWLLTLLAIALPLTL